MMREEQGSADPSEETSGADRIGVIGVNNSVNGNRGADQISAIMNALRSAPPTDLAGQRVVRIRDVLLGESLDVISGAKEPIELPTSNVLAFDLETGSRVLVRPSGTEPKLKIR